MLVGQNGPKLFLPICTILSKNDVIITDFFQSRVRGHDEISRLHVRAGEASWCSIAVFFAFLATNEQARNHDDLLLRGFESGGKLGFSAAMNVIEGSQDWKDSVDFVSLRSVVGQSTSEARFATVTFPFPSIPVSAPVVVNASMLRRICDGGICGGTSTVSVSLPFSSPASWQRSSTHRNTGYDRPFKRHALLAGSRRSHGPLLCSTLSRRCDTVSVRNLP